MSYTKCNNYFGTGLSYWTISYLLAFYKNLQWLSTFPYLSKRSHKCFNMPIGDLEKYKTCAYKPPRYFHVISTQNSIMPTSGYISLSISGSGGGLVGSEPNIWAFPAWQLLYSVLLLLSLNNLSPPFSTFSHE